MTSTGWKNQTAENTTTHVPMASPIGSGFAAYTLLQLDTGMPLYTTTATQEEILNANHNLKNAGESVRFYRAGSYTMPSLHGSH